MGRTDLSILSLVFFTPWMAWAGLALAAVPIIIHFLNRRRFKVVPWAAMDFLLAAMKRNRRRLKFEQWVLLAARCGVVILLGLALARPMGCDARGWASWAVQQRGLNVIVVNTSYSMGYEVDQSDAATHLDQAKRLAGGLIERLGAGGQSVALVTAGRPAAAVLSPPTYDLQQASAAVERIGQSASDCDMAEALEKALGIARQSKEPQKRLYILTDATRSAWTGPQAAAIRQLGPELARTFQISLFNLGLAQQANRAILSLATSGHLISTHYDSDIKTRVGTFGPLANESVRWTMDGRPIGAEQEAGGQANKDLTTTGVQFDQAGAHVVAATLAAGDHLKIDDRRWCVVDAVSKLKVLLVEGSRGVAPMSGSASFLKLALAPPVQGNSNQTAGDMEPTVISDLELPNQVLGENRAVIFTNVARVDEQEARQLRQYVEQGGAVLWFMGDQVDGDSYNRILLPLGLMPGTLTKRISAQGAAGESGGIEFDFNPNGLLHPYLDAFRNQEKSGLGTARIFTYWQMDPSPKLRVQRILNYRTVAQAPEDPAITVHDLGRGRIVFFSTTANADWTSLPAKPAYVALMNELVSHAITRPGQWMNLTVGQRLIVPSSLQLTAAPSLSDPRRNAIPLIQVMADVVSRYESPPLDWPGVYTLQTGAGSYPVAVNVPADEADVRTLNNAALQQALGGVEMTLYGDQLPAPGATAGSGGDWSRALLLVVLLLAGVECYMAMRFGHYRRS